jgi:hypothetical protein
MLEYAKTMSTFEGEHLERVVQPVLRPWEYRRVLVTHDETYFYSNDCKKSVWLEDRESVLKKKGQGRAIMVSAFACSCHGLFNWTKIVPGANADGYWKKADMAHQLQEAVKVFKDLHPGTIGVFCFDQSSNHSAMPDDALNAKYMNLGSGGKQRVPRNGWFIRGAQKIVQEMHVDGAPKGLKKVLQERGLWTSDRMRLECGGEPADMCCARHVMSEQPDFQEQRSLLQETVENEGMKFELYPKFHCECNWIERVWAEAKRLAREQCDYSFASLNERVPGILSSITPERCKRYEGRAWRFIEAYAKGADVRIANWAVNQKYTSHRRLPPTLDFKDFDETDTSNRNRA